MASRKTVPRAKLKKAARSLDKLPEPQKQELTLREAISELRDSIRAALRKGYSYNDLSRILAKQGIDISPHTLPEYLREARQGWPSSAASRESAQRSGSLEASAGETGQSATARSEPEAAGTGSTSAASAAKPGATPSTGSDGAGDADAATADFDPSAL